MIKIFILLIILITLPTCISKKITHTNKCGTLYKNNYKNIIEDKLESIVKGDTLLLNEIKFNCVFSAFYTQKVMFDKFGKWDNEIYLENQRSPILLWRGVQLFRNDTTKFIVAAKGEESLKSIYASVLVFDQNNNDLLAESSKYKNKLINYFSQQIKSNKNKKGKFYEIYWKIVDPKHWETIQFNKKIYYMNKKRETSKNLIPKSRISNFKFPN